MELVDRPAERPRGAGEPAAAMVPSAVSNAVSDAAGVRLRSAPFTAAKLRARRRGRNAPPRRPRRNARHVPARRAGDRETLLPAARHRGGTGVLHTPHRRARLNLPPPHATEGIAMRIGGKRVLVTGGSRGIGRGIALALGARGARVAVHYRSDEAAARDALLRLRDLGADGMVAQADVTRPEEIGRLFAEVEAGLGGLDILVCGARPELGAFYAPPMRIVLDHWEAAMGSQARAFLLCVQAAARIMPESGGGRILAVTYAPGARTGSWQPWVAMGAAKAAMESLVRSFAVALAPRGITVNAVSPGCVFGPPNAVEGSVLRGLPAEVQETIRAWHASGWTPMRRLATPEEVGGVAALLCAEEAGFVTGQTLQVDGGASLMDPVFPLDVQGAAAAAVAVP